MNNIEKQLTEIPLCFKDEKYINLFKDKNNKTLEETISSKRYKSLEDDVRKNYRQSLDNKLGDFLLKLKFFNNDFYKKFLNKYGDLEYSIFSIQNDIHGKLKGVYFYYLDDELKYIGRCKDSMRLRVNNGYGKISPKNCFKDGQSTNCKINSLITKHKNYIKLKMFPMTDGDEIEELEKSLIKKLNPEWNSRK